MLSELPDRKVTFADGARFSAMNFAASILRMATSPGPCSVMASAIIEAASDSPSALKIAAFISSSRCMTTNFALSAFCCATCLDSMEAENSFENCRCVMETSSS